MKTHSLSRMLVNLGLILSMGQALAQTAGNLTPVGAEKAGNKDGSIPAWSGQEQPTGTWSYGKQRSDFWRHKDEKPLFTIDASNVDQYASKLSAGQINLIKTNKGYTMPVYPSHRTCGFPDFTVPNTEKNAAGKAKIAADGWSLEDAALPGVPFPQPKSGIEAMWNFMTRYQGAGVDEPEYWTVISPAPGSDKGIEIGVTQFLYMPWAVKGTHSPKNGEGDSLQMGVYYGLNKPAGLAGQAIAQRLYYSKETESFYYFPGQRRVRRMPSYSHDAPLIGTENQLTVDMAFVFAGNPDRFDWKLVGKKEMYIPYNNFQATRFDVPVSQAVLPSHVAPEFRRYELHRVWEIVGTVKDGVRHTAPKKTIYLDEDSWIAAVGDDYDAQGKLWRTKENNVIPLWEIKACAGFMQANYYDFSNGRYVADAIQHGTKKGFRAFEDRTSDPRMKDDYYTADALRVNSER